jgi:hypothetical protein
VLLAKLGKRAIIEAAAPKVRSCPTGRGVAAATLKELLVFVSMPDRTVDSVDLEVGVTPDAISAAVDAGEWVDAVGMGLSLGRTETDAVCSVVGKVPLGVMEFVAAHLPARLTWMIEALAKGV